MARTTVRMKIHYDANYVANTINSILLANKYKFKTVRNETIWSKGDGVFLKQSCFAYWFQEGDLFVQAWVYDALVGESDVSGIVVLKKKMRSMLDEIQRLV